MQKANPTRELGPDQSFAAREVFSSISTPDRFLIFDSILHLGLHLVTTFEDDDAPPFVVAVDMLGGALKLEETGIFRTFCALRAPMLAPVYRQLLTYLGQV